MYEYVRDVDKGEQSCSIAVPRPIPHRDYNPMDVTNHEAYCRDMLTLFKPWVRTPNNLLPEGSTWIVEFERFLDSGSAPIHLRREISRYNHRQQFLNDADVNSEPDGDNAPDLMASQPPENFSQHDPRPPEDWMLAIAPYFDDRSIGSITSQDVQLYYGDDDYAWDEYAMANPTYERDLQQFATQLVARNVGVNNVPRVVEDPRVLRDNQRLVFSIVLDHFRNHVGRDPLYLVVNGTAGSGKSKIIHLLLQHLPGVCRVVAPSGVAAFNVDGVTIHSLLKIPINTARNAVLQPLNGQALKGNFAWGALPYH